MANTKIDIEEAPAEVFPKCPFCKEEIQKIWIKKRGLGAFGSAEKQFIICPHCRALLGYGAFHI